MKTLDEVIWAVEHCDSAVDCTYCSYFTDDCEDLRQLRSDALHYLKEYRELVQKTHQLDAEDGDEPLTWEELKEMVGKPVWMELIYPEGTYFHWGIISGFSKVGYEWLSLRGFYEIDPFSVMDKEQGKTWNAYRRERNENAG